MRQRLPARTQLAVRQRLAQAVGRQRRDVLHEVLDGRRAGGLAVGGAGHLVTPWRHLHGVRGVGLGQVGRPPRPLTPGVLGGGRVGVAEHADRGAASARGRHHAPVALARAVWSRRVHRGGGLELPTPTPSSTTTTTTTTATVVVVVGGVHLRVRAAVAVLGLVGLGAVGELSPLAVSHHPLLLLLLVGVVRRGRHHHRLLLLHLVWVVGVGLGVGVGVGVVMLVVGVAPHLLPHQHLAVGGLGVGRDLRLADVRHLHLRTGAAVGVRVGVVVVVGVRVGVGVGVVVHAHHPPSAHPLHHAHPHGAEGRDGDPPAHHGPAAGVLRVGRAQGVGLARLARLAPLARAR